MDQRTRAEMPIIVARLMLTTLIVTPRTVTTAVGILITMGHQAATETFRIARGIEIPDEATTMEIRITTETAIHKIAEIMRPAIQTATAHQAEATTRTATEACNGRTIQTATAHQTEATTRTAAQARRTAIRMAGVLTTTALRVDAATRHTKTVHLVGMGQTIAEMDASVIIKTIRDNNQTGDIVWIVTPHGRGILSFLTHAFLLPRDYLSVVSLQFS
jgi:hypothetical protein